MKVIVYTHENQDYPILYTKLNGVYFLNKIKEIFNIKVQDNETSSYNILYVPQE